MNRLNHIVFIILWSKYHVGATKNTDVNRELTNRNNMLIKKKGK